MTDEWDDDRPLADWEYPDGEDEDALDESPTHECPKCGCDVYDDAVKCPVCGEYFSREAGAPSSFPVWVRVTTLVVLAVLILTIWRCLF